MLKKFDAEEIKKSINRMNKILNSLDKTIKVHTEIFNTIISHNMINEFIPSAVKTNVLEQAEEYVNSKIQSSRTKKISRENKW